MENAPKAEGTSSGTSVLDDWFGLISRLDDMVRDMTENREPRVVDWPGTIRQAVEELRKVQSAPRAVSAEADFDAMTWTFQIGPQCRVGGGTYALVRLTPNANVTGLAPAQENDK